jgi:aminoglycoside phosphotransferase family enzyme
MMFDAEISTEQRYWWRIALNCVRQCHGDAFQDFFSIVMGHP